jgi:hypothetical protein
MHSKIYKIVSDKTDKCYVGCTDRCIKTRFIEHMSDYRTHSGRHVTSFDIIKYGDARVELIEEFEYQTKKERRDREGHYVRTMNTVNRHIPNRSKAERGREWYSKNKEAFNEKRRNSKAQCDLCCKLLRKDSMASHKRNHCRYKLYLEHLGEFNV